MTTFGMRSVWPATCALLLSVAAGCGTKPPPPTEVTGVLQAASNVNPSTSKRPSPLLVRVYQLKSATAFNSADFVSLYQGDQSELGTEMIGREEVIGPPMPGMPMPVKVATSIQACASGGLTTWPAALPSALPEPATPWVCSPRPH